MRHLCFDTRELDNQAREKFLLPSEILMENAARGMAEFLAQKFPLGSKILMICGSGDNGGDCLALARMLVGKYSLGILLPLGVKSTLAKTQLKRLEACDSSVFIPSLEGIELSSFDIIIDGLFGIGFRGEFSFQMQNLITLLNETRAIKIACDIPSGIDLYGNPRFLGEIPFAFRADFTLTMGALKNALFSDYAKDFVGEICCLELGISESVFAPNSNFKLLESSDFKAPKRNLQNCNKGSFGHLSVLGGEKIGASLLSALAGFRMGAGLVSFVSDIAPSNLPYEVMYANFIPKNTTAIALGMGFGRKNPLSLKMLKDFWEIPILLDADIFYHEVFGDLIQNFSKVILTPHPKEFSTILRVLEKKEMAVEVIQKNRIALAQDFSSKYPNTTLILKGANSLIAKNGEVYINPLGSNALAKGGSGDVLAGIIAGLLAQNYSSLEACIQGVLAHSLCAQKFIEKNADFSLSPLDLIDQIRYL